MRKNSFYYGMMRTKYGLAEHHYEPVISTSLFQQAQNVFVSHHKKPHKKISEPFILRGMITYSHCGCTVTLEIHKKRYIYYSCTNAKGICKKVYIREQPLPESLLHTEEQNRIQKRINQMYDDKLDGLINEKIYLDKVKD